MLERCRSVCYALLRPAQVRARREKSPLAHIVAGSLERHSFRNPLGTDALKAHAICCEAALKHGGVLLPPLYLGLFLPDRTNWGPRDWEGFTLGISDGEALEPAVFGLASALVDGGASGGSDGISASRLHALPIRPFILPMLSNIYSIRSFRDILVSLVFAFLF